MPHNPNLTAPNMNPSPAIKSSPLSSPVLKDRLVSSPPSMSSPVLSPPRSITSDLVDKEDLFKNLQAELALYKKKVAELTHHNNLYHLAMSNCGYCTLSGAPIDPLPSSPPNPTPSTPSSPIASLTPTVSPIASSVENDKSIIPARKKHKKDKAFVDRMVHVLIKLEKKYAIPQHKRKPAMFQRKQRTNHIVPKVFAAIYHLLLEPQANVTVPEPYPTVDWSTVRFKPPLPNPEQMPILSVSQDPDTYAMKSSAWSGDQSYSTFTSKNPFSTLPGYQTSHGVVAVPNTPVQGYLYCAASNKWVLAASTNRGTEGATRGT